MNTMAVCFSIGCVMVLSASGAPATHTKKTEVPHSVFTLPAKPAEGRDPFFPNSLRPYVVAATVVPQVADIKSLVVRGFSGSMDHRLVIINNHTFAAGDEGDVITSTGHLHLRCIEIRTNSVVIEVGGQFHELFYTDQL